MATNVPWYPELCYHVYNRGHNHSKIFFNSANYLFFLDRITKYVGNWLDVLAFVLIPNHFHLIVKVKSEPSIINFYKNTYHEKFIDNISLLLSQQLSNMLNSYAKAINRQENRSGSIFDGKCQRKLIDTNEYLTCAILYTHMNPLKHKISIDPLNYQWSSYHLIISNNEIFIDRPRVYQIFNGYDHFIDCHKNYQKYITEKKIKKYWIE